MFLKDHNKTAFIWKHNNITYQQILNKISHFASLFDPANCSKTAVFLENRPEWAYAFYSAWKNKCVAVPLDYMSPAVDLTYMLDDCKPEVIFCSNQTENVVNEAQSELEYKIQVINVDNIESEEESETPEWPHEINKDEVATILYTSGTTGNPKGVMLTFGNLLANINSVSLDVSIYTPERSVMALLPFHHVFPLMATLVAPLFIGMTIAFAPGLKSGAIMSTLQNHRIAIIVGVPRLYYAIHKGIMDKINKNKITRFLFKTSEKINSRAFSRKLFKTVHRKFGGNLDFLVSGGAKLDNDIAKDFNTLGFEILEGFGMTEAAPMITFTRPGKWKIGSAGQPMKNVEVKIKDNEIIARGPNIMKGYYKRPEETSEILKDGWLYTGDTGYLDQDNYLHITGRKKEIIVLSNGKNINPELLENKICSLSDLILEAGVFARDDALHALIVPDFDKIRQKGILNADATIRDLIINRYNSISAPHQKIFKYILCKEELPKTRIGKIQRFKLPGLVGKKYKKEKFTTGEPAFEEYYVIRDYLKERTNGDVFPDDHIEIDLGLDSLEKVGFQSFLQASFGVDIHEDILIKHPTIEKLSHYIKEKKKWLKVEAIKWAEILKEKTELQLPKRWKTQNLLKNGFRVLLKTYFRLRGEGVDNIPDGPVILAPNHQSYLDGLFISVFLKNKVMKRTYFYVKEKHMRSRFLKGFANRHNIIIMDVNKELKQSLQKLAAVLQEGKNVIIFPEGTRSFDGTIGSLKKSFAILSKELSVPVVPVSIKGAYEAIPRGHKIPKAGKPIYVKFHKPVYPDDLNYDNITEIVFQKLSAELA